MRTEPLVHQEAVMGTVVTFAIHAQAPRLVVDAALGEAVEWLHWVDDNFSTFKEGSEVNRFDRGELVAGDGSPELVHVLALCHRFARETGGYFDAWVSGHFDPSGVVKGWSIDRASDILFDHGLADHLIDGGGDIRFRGVPLGSLPWRVGVRHPLDESAYCAALGVAEGAVATSGTYERGRHVIDPFSGQPSGELAAVTVVGPELTACDAYATAALAMGADAPAWLSSLPGFESQVVTPAGRGWRTGGFARLEMIDAGAPAA
jgi:thiamine biosynthesis lipoprotein